MRYHVGVLILWILSLVYCVVDYTNTEPEPKNCTYISQQFCVIENSSELKKVDISHVDVSEKQSGDLVEYGKTNPLKELIINFIVLTLLMLLIQLFICMIRSGSSSSFDFPFPDL